MSSSLALPAASAHVELVGLRRWRQYRNFSQQTLATILGVTRQTVSDWECGKSHPRWRHVQQLREILHAPIEALFPPEERRR